MNRGITEIGIISERFSRWLIRFPGIPRSWVVNDLTFRPIKDSTEFTPVRKVKAKT